MVKNKVCLNCKAVHKYNVDKEYMPGILRYCIYCRPVPPKFHKPKNMVNIQQDLFIITLCSSIVLPTRSKQW